MLDDAAALIRQHLADVIAIYVFGSVARGSERPESDVDLAVLSAAPIAPRRRFELQETLAVALGRDVDLVDLGGASTVLRAQVVGHGRLLYDGDGPRRRVFEMLALSDYARLNEERAPVLAAIAARGSVYGR